VEPHVTLADAERRRRALSDLDSTLLVEAAAGTGKTSIMAGRVAMLLASGRAPRNIAAITFTELAASELSHRIRGTVAALLAGGIPKFLQLALPGGLAPARLNALAGAAENLDELTTTTIHGFCQSIIRTNAVAAGLDPGFKVVDAAGATALFDNVFSRWLISRLSGVGQGADPIVVLSRDKPLTIVETIKKLAHLRRGHPTARPLSASLDARHDIGFVQAVTDFARWYASNPGDRQTADIIAGLEKLATFYTDALNSQPDFAELWRLAHPPRVGAMKEDSNELAPYRRKSAWKNAFRGGRGEQLSREAEALFDAVNRAYATLLGAIARALIATVSDALDGVLTAYAARKRAAAVVDFDDLLLHAREVVKTNETVRQALGSRYQYILVDEFQDTDRIQTEILFYIAAQARPEHWHDALVRPGALFLVGDPKQAIYRFRGADIEVYDQAKGLVSRQPAGAVIELTANFRSQKPILDHVNDCFEPVLSGTNQPGYVALSHTIDHADDGLPCVAKLTVSVPNGASAHTQRDAEAQAVAQLCERLIGAVEVARADGSRSLLRAGDIALLAPTAADLWRFERALEAKRISVASQAGRALMRRQETQDILALVRILASPFDTLAFGAFMRGPLVGLTEQQLLDITASLPAVEGKDRPSFTVQTDVEAISDPVAKSVVLTMQHLRRRAAVTTPMLLLSEAIERLHVRVLLTARYGNRSVRALANLDTLIEKARAYGVAGLQAFVHDLHEAWERQLEAPEGRSDSSEEAVEIVTMHSSKGLEWPVVIPINTATRLRSPGPFVHRQSDNTLHWLLEGVAPPDLDAARDEEGASEARQRERLLYVACTRARDLLIIPHLPSAHRRSWSRIMNLGHHRLPEIDVRHLERAVAKAPVTGGNAQTADRFAWEAEKVAAASPAMSWRRPSDHDPDRRALATATISEASDELETILPVGAGRLRGILLHKLMEEFLTGELEEEEAHAQARARVLLDQLASGDAETDTPLPDAAEMASTALRTIRLPEIAGLRERLVPEIAVWSATESEFLSGRADAVAGENGRVDAVLDWKSDINPSAAQRKDHLGQLAEYVSVTDAKRGAIVYMSLGEVVWLDSSISR
jgi:ATP-dependent exoDNAse (exonuclease V) beta subunit